MKRFFLLIILLMSLISYSVAGAEFNASLEDFGIEWVKINFSPEPAPQGFNGSRWTIDRERYIGNFSGSLGVNETQLNATIDARSGGGTHNGTTPNTTIQMIRAVNGTALNGTRFIHLNYSQLFGIPPFLRNWSVENNTIFNFLFALNASNFTQAANITSLSVRIDAITGHNGTTPNTTIQMINAVNGTSLNGTRFIHLNYSQLFGVPPFLRNWSIENNTIFNFLFALNASNFTQAANITSLSERIDAIGPHNGTSPNTSIQMIRAVNLSRINASHFKSLNWTMLFNYPVGCTGGQVVSVVGDDLTCISMNGTTPNTTQQMINAVIGNLSDFRLNISALYAGNVSQALNITSLSQRIDGIGPHNGTTPNTTAQMYAAINNSRNISFQNLTVTANLTTQGGIFTPDNVGHYFGNDDDCRIFYNSSSSALEIHCG